MMKLKDPVVIAVTKTMNLLKLISTSSTTRPWATTIWTATWSI